MTHHHHHRGAHAVPEAALGRAFAWGIALNTAFVAIEAAVGASLRLDGAAVRRRAQPERRGEPAAGPAGIPPGPVHARPRYTYGYRKEHGARLAAQLGRAAGRRGGDRGGESIGRMLHPMPVEGGVIAWTAGAGVAVNGFTAWLFVRDKERDLNVKGAYLHMAADALVSVGVLVSGLVIARTGWMFVDPVIGVVVAGVIVASVWSLTRDSLRLALDGVPPGLDPASVERAMLGVEGAYAKCTTSIFGPSAPRRTP